MNQTNTTRLSKSIIGIKSLSIAKPSNWTILAALLALLILTPVLTIVSFLFAPSSDTWQHLASTVLPDYIQNSLILMAGVALGAGSIGITTAWLTSVYQFPGRKFLTWALLLPLAMPAYIIAYTYSGMLEVAGPLQEWIRATFDVSYGEYWFPNIRSTGGAICMFSLVLYPYVYLLARASFLEQSVCALEASRTLGCNQWRSFWLVALPLARPAIVTGISLALMETLADFGTVEYFGVTTFTTGIFRTWYGMYDEVGAAQLSSVLMSFVFILILLERWSRKRSRFHHSTNRYQNLPSITLSPVKRWLATLACALPLILGFILPFWQLSDWAIMTFDEMVDDSFYQLMTNSFTLAAAAAVITLIPAIILAYGLRHNRSTIYAGLVRLSTMGYAIPGTVIAVGILIPFGRLDNTIDSWFRTHLDISTGLIFSGTLFILLFAYMVRFFTVALNTMESGLGKIRPSMDEAARSMGYSNLQILRRIHLPIMRGSLLTALLIVFVDTLKELPATLVLRPFNFNTLAVRAYELASDERLADASTAAIAIVLVGIIPVILISRTIATARPGHESSNST